MSILDILNNLPSLVGNWARLENATTSDDKPTELTRYVGGHNREVQPYITGYHQVIFFLPYMLFTTSTFPAEDWLHCTCESFTPHTYSINMGDVPGVGQVSTSYPISRTTNREFTLSFREYTKMPILTIIKAWHSLFNPLFGASFYGKGIAVPFAYKGTAIVYLLKPTCDKDGEITDDDIEEVYVYQGVYPITCPEDVAAQSDQATNESVVLPVTFKFDGAPADLSILAVKSLVLLAINKNYKDTYKKLLTNV